MFIALTFPHPSLAFQDDEEEEGVGKRGKKRLKRSRFVDDIAAVDEDEEDEEDDQVSLRLLKQFLLSDPVLASQRFMVFVMLVINFCVYHSLKATISFLMRGRSCQRWRTWAGGVHATPNLCHPSLCVTESARLC